MVGHNKNDPATEDSGVDLAGGTGSEISGSDSALDQGKPNSNSDLALKSTKSNKLDLTSRETRSSGAKINAEIMKIMEPLKSPESSIGSRWRENKIKIKNKDETIVVPIIRLEIPRFIIKSDGKTYPTKWSVKLKTEGEPERIEMTAQQVMTALAEKIEDSGILKTVKANIARKQSEEESSNVIIGSDTVSLIVKPAHCNAAGIAAFQNLKTSLHNVPKQEWETPTTARWQAAPRSL